MIHSIKPMYTDIYYRIVDWGGSSMQGSEASIHKTLPTTVDTGREEYKLFYKVRGNTVHKMVLNSDTHCLSLYDCWVKTIYLVTFTASLVVPKTTLKFWSFA